MANVLKTAEFDGKLRVTETIDYGIDGVANEDAIFEIAGLSGSLSPGTTIPATKVYKNQASLVAAARTIDLTALVNDNLPNIDASGLKLQAFIFKNNSTTGSLTIADGASNSYELFGDASGQVTLPAGTGTNLPFVMIYAPEGLDDVAAGDAEIDLTSSGDDTLSYDVELLFG